VISLRMALRSDWTTARYWSVRALPLFQRNCLRAPVPPRMTSAPSEQPVDERSNRHEERAAIIEYGAGVPREWAEGFARLDPGRPPDDVPGKRWLQFVHDCGMFLDGGWAARAAALGWGPLDLFGCDRERPFARVDHLGLLWLLKGGTVVELHRDQAVIRIADGARQTYRRRPVEFGRVVLAWELSP
jgi:hypothetical protein